MIPSVDIYFYSDIENKWVEINKSFKSVLSDIVVTLNDFDIDNFSITLDFIQDYGIYEGMINSPYLLEGTLVQIAVGYQGYPRVQDVLMYGIIVGTKVKESVDSVTLTLFGTDMSVLLKSKIINTEILKDMSKDFMRNNSTKDNAPVLLVREILTSNNKRLEKFKDKAKSENNKLPDFGLNFTEETIPNVTSEELKYRRFVSVSDMKGEEILTARKTGSEWGIANKPAYQEFQDNLKSGSGYEIYTTYIDTITSLGTILGRIFWFDSKTQKCYFIRPADIVRENSFAFYKTNAVGVSPFERILDFEADYTSLDSVWAIQNSFVSVYKDATGQVVVKPIIVHMERDEQPKSTEETSIETENPIVPVLTGLDTLITQTSNAWEHIKRTSPDTFEAVNSQKTTFYLRDFTVTASVVIQGNPAIRPHDIVYVYGVGSKFEGAWLVSEVVHNISTEKYFTSVGLARNILGIPKGFSGDFEKIVNEKITKTKTEVSPNTSSKPIIEVKSNVKPLSTEATTNRVKASFKKVASRPYINKGVEVFVPKVPGFIPTRLK